MTVAHEVSRHVRIAKHAFQDTKDALQHVLYRWRIRNRPWEPGKLNVNSHGISGTVEFTRCDLDPDHDDVIERAILVILIDRYNDLVQAGKGDPHALGWLRLALESLSGRRTLQETA